MLMPRRRIAFSNHSRHRQLVRVTLPACLLLPASACLYLPLPASTCHFSSSPDQTAYLFASGVPELVNRNRLFLFRSLDNLLCTRRMSSIWPRSRQ